MKSSSNAKPAASCRSPDQPAKAVSHPICAARVCTGSGHADFQTTLNAEDAERCRWPSLKVLGTPFRMLWTALTPVLVCSTVPCADGTTDVGPTVARFLKHVKALKASDPFCTSATIYPGARIPTQCAVRKQQASYLFVSSAGVDSGLQRESVETTAARRRGLASTGARTIQIWNSISSVGCCHPPSFSSEAQSSVGCACNLSA